MSRKPRTAKVEEETSAVANGSSQLLSTLLKENKTEHLNFEERVFWKISSGSLLLDEAMGGGIEPSLIRLCGDNNEGKTPEALEVIRNFLLGVPNSRALWIMAEGRLSRQNKERCELTFTTNAEEWKDGTVFVLESNSYEFIIDTIKNLVLSNPENKKFVFCIDSLDGVIAKADRDKKAVESARVAGPQVLSKKMMQSLSLGMFKYGHLMILISQVTSQIQLDKYVKTANRGGNFSGGNSLLHQSDFILEYQSSGKNDIILDNPDGKLDDGHSKPIGKWAKVILSKSTEETTRKTTIKYPIKFGRRPSGIWLEYEVIDNLRMYHLTSHKGAWISFREDIHAKLSEYMKEEVPKQFNGINKFREYLEQNSKVTNYFFNEIKELCG